LLYLDMSLPTRINVSLPTDENGYLGRECPVETCEGYFKIKPGTGLKGKDLPCHCPYCGHVESPNHFATKDQIEFAKSVALGKITDALRGELKKLEFDIKPKGPFGIGISMKLQPGQPVPLKRYHERTLETYVCCHNCTLDYAVYGVFAFCPDCGHHNSLQILQKNVDLIRKQLSLATAQSDLELKRHLIEDALENCVSAFDGFARETCRVRASCARDPATCANMSFQNLARAAEKVSVLFGVDMKSTLSNPDFRFAHTAFMRRHLIAHRGGVIDDRYLAETGDTESVRGRRVTVDIADVDRLAAIMLALAEFLVQQLPNLSE
jgi:hypothetical protein